MKTTYRVIDQEKYKVNTNNNKRFAFWTCLTQLFFYGHVRHNRPPTEWEQHNTDLNLPH